MLPTLLTLTALLSPAAAHPLGIEAWSVRSGLQITEQGTIAMVVGEVPIGVVTQDLRARAPVDQAVALAYTRERQRELMDGTSLRVDGEAVALSWEPAPSAMNGRAVDGFFVYAILARLPDDAVRDGATMELRCDAWSDRSTVHATDVRAAPPYRVVRSSARADWTADPRARTLRLTVQTGPGVVDAAPDVPGSSERSP